VAAFLAMVYLLPFDSTQLSISLPVDSKLDRVLLLVILGVWIPAMATIPELRRRLPALGPLGVALVLWVGVALVSVVVNLPSLVVADEFSLATKKLTLLLSYVGFFLVVVSVIRPTEVRPFVTLLIGLACLTALGAVYQYRFSTNLFFQWANDFLPGPFDVGPAPTARSYDRPPISGPALHGLALTTMLVLAVPFAVQRLLESEDRRRKFVYGVATALILAGSMATLRRSAGVVPVVALAALIAYRPRQMWRLAPMGVVLIILIQALAPGALRTVQAQITGSAGFGQNSIDGRTADYPAIVPDVLAHPLLGKGYGTYNPDTYRIVDNQILLTLLDSGALGLLALVGVLAATFFLAHRSMRRASGERAPPALAAVAAIPAFAVSLLLYDTLGYAQSVYLFFFIAAVTVIGASGHHGPRPRLAPSTESGR
jgi:hypothetical protein